MRRMAIVAIAVGLAATACADSSEQPASKEAHPTSVEAQAADAETQPADAESQPHEATWIGAFDLQGEWLWQVDTTVAYAPFEVIDDSVAVLQLFLEDFRYERLTIDPGSGSVERELASPPSYQDGRWPASVGFLGAELRFSDPNTESTWAALLPLGGGYTDPSAVRVGDREVVVLIESELGPNQRLVVLNRLDGTERWTLDGVRDAAPSRFGILYDRRNTTIDGEGSTRDVVLVDAADPAIVLWSRPGTGALGGFVGSTSRVDVFLDQPPWVWPTAPYPTNQPEEERVPRPVRDAGLILAGPDGPAVELLSGPTELLVGADRVAVTADRVAVAVRGDERFSTPALVHLVEGVSLLAPIEAEAMQVEWFGDLLIVGVHTYPSD